MNSTKFSFEEIATVNVNFTEHLLCVQKLLYSSLLELLNIPEASTVQMTKLGLRTIDILLKVIQLVIDCHHHPRSGFLIQDLD